MKKMMVILLKKEIEIGISFWEIKKKFVMFLKKEIENGMSFW